ncbi:unnamed protein product [Paramecium pentaurelia]|uniref:Uncharacterized protein n=1 Tax=Paramecium pentaurelia TaxID=43138 RepID=A0A8S1UAV3_9CILI|nr:unnamed protein product [Paramecium pentaurelia]
MQQKINNKELQYYLAQLDLDLCIIPFIQDPNMIDKALEFINQKFNNIQIKEFKEA